MKTKLISAFSLQPSAFVLLAAFTLFTTAARAPAQTFTNINAGLPGVSGGSVAWSDYDNDGRLDILLTGNTNPGQIAQVWRNTGSGFTNLNAGLPGLVTSSVAWGDYDNDGQLDFLLTGHTGGNSNSVPIFVSQLWRNTGSGFTNINDSLPGVGGGSVAWGDYDNDGRLDILLTGDTGPSRIAQVWRNTGSGFTDINAGLPGVAVSSVTWGDYDNDGRLDILLTGESDSANISQVWRNTGSGFTNINAGLPGVEHSSVAWGDYDNDGRLDILLTGHTTGSVVIAQVWRNYTPISNTPPSAPTGLAMTATANAVMLSWNSAADDQTPASGLSYNVRAGTTPGGNDLLSAHVNATNGFRRVPALGNAMLRHSLPLTGLTNGQPVYWSVQAVDTAFAGGPFATETSVVNLPVLSVSLNSQPSTLNLSWTPPTFGWVLQQSILNSSNWTTTASGSANPATLPATNGAQFYRLSKP